LENTVSATGLLSHILGVLVKTQDYFFLVLTLVYKGPL